MEGIGIDLGTTFSVAAVSHGGATPELIPDSKAHLQYLTPSVVHVDKGFCLVGETAEKLALVKPSMPIMRHAKLAMGRNQSLFTDDSGREWYPEMVSALILRKLLRDAEVRYGQMPQRAVIGVPANFNSRQRSATILSARLAGLEKAELIDEPIAAAVAYGRGLNNQEQTIFVYDLGGGTFDATVLHISPDGLQVLATQGSTNIGGEYFTEMIGADVGALYEKRFGRIPRSIEAQRTIRTFSEQLKTTLNASDRYRIWKRLMLDEDVLDICYTYHHLSRIMFPEINNTLNISTQCVKEAGLNWNQIDKILITGGASMFPAIAEQLRNISGKAADDVVVYQARESVAFGAASIANTSAVSGNRGYTSDLIHTVSGYDIGLLTLNPNTKKEEVEYFIRRNDPLPKIVTKTFYKNRDEQEKLHIHIVQRKEQDTSSGAISRFEIDGLHHISMQMPINIEMRCSQDGVLHISVTDSEKNIEASGLRVLDDDLNESMFSSFGHINHLEII